MTIFKNPYFWQVKESCHSKAYEYFIINHIQVQRKYWLLGHNFPYKIIQILSCKVLEHQISYVPLYCISIIVLHCCFLSRSLDSYCSSSDREYKLHVESHFEDLFKCLMCDYTNSKWYRVKIHMQVFLPHCISNQHVYSEQQNLRRRLP